MTISIIVAVAENNVIGNNNDLIWHISEDLKRFKKLTSGHPIIMGRKTYESLPVKPLPGRRNIIVSTQKNVHFEGAVTVNSFSEALKQCDSDDEAFICGGATIYKHFLNHAQFLYLTKVHREFEGDTYFPAFDLNNWQLIEQSERKNDLNSNLEYTFLTYKLKDGK